MVNRLVFQTLAWAAALLGGYALVLQIVKPNIATASTSSLSNRVFVERYVYGHPAPNVLVGSSLTRRLPASALGPDFTNLALDGQSALTGMAIVASAPTAPKRIYIEINQIALGADAALLHSVFHEPLFSLRKNIVALRAAYRPSNILYGLVRGNKPVDASGSRTMTPRQRDAVLVETGRLLHQPLAPARLRAMVQAVKDNIARLDRRGIQPVFFELPIEREFRDLPLPAQIRATMRAAFPVTRRCWIVLNLPKAETLDGLHLADADAGTAAAIFRHTPACEASPARR